MSEISKAYEPQSVEDKWYQFWLDGKFFVADAKSPKPAYSIVIPPPNVTGVLTLGHVLNNTIQDILARKARMDGKEVLWLPGTDHAGIATQTVVERALKKEGKIKHRDDLGREKFLEEVWKWKNEKGGIIIQQLKKLGASCDWTRERFTMDPEYSRCVQRVFVDLYKKGLIYRGKRMVNWCPASLTALSDEEVMMKEQKGFLYYFKVEVEMGSATVPVADSGVAPESSSDKNKFERRASGATPDAATGTVAFPGEKIFLTIATTRPETIPGDTAVAVNPKDPRYAHLIGKNVVRPLPMELPREQKLIPIIGDEHVDFEFGTGVLKVTPAHDKADFEIGLRHKLPAVEIMSLSGQMNKTSGADLCGLDRFKARKVAAEKLAELGVLEKQEPYTNNVGFSERADVPIEPFLLMQWFLKYPSVESSRAVVATGKMKFHPERWAKVYDHWLSAIQDWCVSRQIWWGHRIPVWYFVSLNPQNIVEKVEQLHSAGFSSENCRWVVVGENSKRIPLNNFIASIESYRNAESNLEVCGDFSAQEIDKLETELGFVQDPDVLDTWFSSWLWPFATMGWPEQTDTLKKFYPTTDLVTGPDIIFFWVARMIMAGYEYMGDPKFGLPDAMPFQNVYFTGIIRDKQGRKMSKSLGNSPDPLDLIAKFGADALRFGVMRAAPLGQDILFDEQNVELGRNFCNKLWNACRFRQMQGGEVQGEIEPTLLSTDDKWILLKLDAALREVTIALNEYKFSDATAVLYRFFWSEYCDWYVEASKAVLRPVELLNSEMVKSESVSTVQRFNDSTARKANTLAVIDFVLSHTLRLFHPFLPFITEELWHGMGYATDMPKNQGGKTIMFAPWPLPLDDDFKGHYGLDDCYLEMGDTKYDLVSQGRNLRRAANIGASKKIKYIFKPVTFMPSHEVEVLKLLLNAESVEVEDNYVAGKGTLTVRTSLGELHLPTEGLIDVAAEQARLNKELEKVEAEIAKVEAKLANPSFTEKVPVTVLQEHQHRLAEWQGKREHVKTALAALG
jgi:valyl-tRNA synthetase